ncbi:MAG: 2-oxoacid:acceptor oxidoreductase family protein [Deltaproteobacteria bacterium]|nr:2-oxoacid:acceptor oxidoreductase family protein [Deltaproteobacteria bacterium]
MIEIRFHGRGGQGAVTSAELLALSAIEEGKFAQAFPSFGPERRGAPVIAFARINGEPILVRSQIYNPGIVVVLDPSILRIVNVTQGMKNDDLLVANTLQSPEELAGKFDLPLKVAVVDATRIAREELGRPITNTTMLGAMLKATDILPLESFYGPFKTRFGSIAERNISALKRAFDETRILQPSS